jgi:hypothetical protein
VYPNDRWGNAVTTGGAVVMLEVDGPSRFVSEVALWSEAGGFYSVDLDVPLAGNYSLALRSQGAQPADGPPPLVYMAVAPAATVPSMTTVTGATNFQVGFLSPGSGALHPFCLRVQRANTRSTPIESLSALCRLFKALLGCLTIRYTSRSARQGPPQRNPHVPRPAHAILLGYQEREPQWTTFLFRLFAFPFSCLTWLFGCLRFRARWVCPRC